MDITKRDILDALLRDFADEWPHAVIERHGGSEVVITVNDGKFYVNVSRRRIPPQVRNAWDDDQGG